MTVTFKDGATSYDCSEPVEQKIFRSGMPAGWAIMFQIFANLSSSEVDEIITPESISDMTFTSNSETFEVTGYENITACTIRHSDTSTRIEVQFTKMEGVN